jgi:hypothetical protein
VVSNLGKPVAEQVSDLKTYTKAVVPDNFKQTPAPNVKPGESLEWPDIVRVVNILD